MGTALSSKGSGHGGAMMGGLLGLGAEHAFDDHNYDGPDTVAVENNYYGDIDVGCNPTGAFAISCWWVQTLDLMMDLTVVILMLIQFLDKDDINDIRAIKSILLAAI
ncbi:CNT_collapsed_G0015730.mRNA.1.CDS.1 [Saccharomyces cerevisiae]|nr:CNT_collapsed_G0015730.mRNA.1.CDS.1 [Saccharomyces cerevisiae]